MGTPEKRPAEAGGDAEPPEKQAKVDTNPLSGKPYTPRFYALLEKRQRLPAWGAREEFLKLIARSQVVVLVGEAGSGKTTQIPQILLDAGYHAQNGQIQALACVQPHDVAASSAAARIAEELEVEIGTFVGYHLRFEDKTTTDTLLRLVTAEALLHEVLTDPNLDRYSVILIDEAQERTLAADVLLALLKGILQKRPDLKLVILSSTEGVSRIQGHFGGCPLLRVPSKTSAVDIYHMSSPGKDYLQVAVRSVLQIHANEAEGDVLLFLASEEEVDQACALLKKEAANLRDSERELSVAPLHEALPLAQHQQAFRAAPAAKSEKGRAGRKVVVATAIAESSIAIDNIVYVVDAGVAKQRVHNPRKRLDCRLVSAISQPSAALRASVASRTKGTGKCFRLYAESSLKQDLPDQAVPEIMRSGLSGVVLMLKKLGVEDLVKFDYPDPPSPEALMRALEGLNHLGCLDEQGAMTEIGEQVVRFPVDPQLGRMLVGASTHRCSNEALSIAAMLSVGTVFLRPSGSFKQADEAKARFAHIDGDHLTLLNAFHAFKQQVQNGVPPEQFCTEQFLNQRALMAAEGIREALRKVMEGLGLPMTSTNFQDPEYYPNIRRCLLAGFFMNVAHLTDEKGGKYLTVKDSQEISLHPTCCLGNKPEWVVCDQLVQTSRLFMRTVTPVKGEWLLDIAPGYFDTKKLPAGAAKEKLEKLAAEKGSA